MPVRTSELLEYIGVNKRTLAKWKERTGVTNRRRGYWSLREFARLEESLARKMSRRNK
jgi:phage terminase Nu1 subunit (DNA packaging protein)